MDLDNNHGSSSSISTSRQRSSSQPSEAPVKRNDEHDSLVTVRLSEPPKQLTLNTNVDTNGTIQNRRSLFSANLSPSPISPSPVSASSETKLDDEIMSPVTTTYGSKANLQQELEALNENEDDTKTISGVEVATESDVDDDDDDDEEEEEEVNWEQLQKTEDAVVKDTDSEDVSFIPVSGLTHGLPNGPPQWASPRATRPFLALSAC
jgi:hypothetical protein